MAKTKRLLSIALVMALMLNALAIGISAVLGDGNELSVDIDLQVGRYVGGTADANWVPLAPGETLAVDDVITVRIAPESDFLCGVTRYITMFSKEFFQIVGSGKSAFTPNNNNAFYAAVAPDWAGATSIPSAGWPVDMRTVEFNDYTAVAVNNAANSNAPNGGYPDYMPGDWLFRFDLKVIKAVGTGSDARIWMDNRWIRNPDYTTGAMYFTKLESQDQLSATGSSTTYYYDVDLTDADVTLPFPMVSYNITFDANGGEGGEVQSVNHGTVPTPPTVTREGYNFVGWTPSLVAATADATYTAQWEEALPTTYEITFDANGGEGGDIQTVNEGDMPVPPVVTREGYIFAGWTPEVAAATEDATYTAQWTINTYEITFDADGGEGGTVQTVDYNTVPQPPTVTKEGYTFAGWTPDIVAATEDATYTAQWTINTFDITFDADGGEGGTVQTVDYGTVPVPPSVSKVGYTFAGWTPDIVAATEDATYTAQWTINTYQITFDANGGEGGTVQTVDYNTVPQPPTVTKEGFNFVSWTPAIVAATEDATYTAVWEEIPVVTYQITFDAAGGEGGEVKTVGEGTVPVPPVVTREGYTFAGWTPDIVEATADATYTAQWTINTFEITFDAAGGEGGEVQTVDYGTVPEAPTVTRAGYTFAGWTPEIVAATANATYTAQWDAITYQITFDSNGGEGGTVLTVNEGDLPVAPVVTREGYTFAGWTPEVAVATEDATYTAQWTILTFEITFDANGGEGSTVQTVDYGTVPEAPTVTRAGYTFAGWTPEIVAATEDATYTAQWEVITYQITFDAAGGEGGTVLTVNEGDLPEAPVVTREGYTFAGWTPEVAVATADATYTAQWTILTFEITFDANGGEGGTVQTVDYGTVPVPPVVTRATYIFLGWTPDVVAATADATYTAQWALESPADYTEVNAAIANKLPSEANRYFYTDEANALIDAVLELIDWNLDATQQATVDGYVVMINDLADFLATVLTEAPEASLVFPYGEGFTFNPVYPYGDDGLQFWPFRDETKAVNTLELAANKATVPAVSAEAGDQNFIVTLSIDSNALNCAGGIPVLFDKTKLELVGVDNAGTNVPVAPTLIGSNYASTYLFSGTLNPGAASFWPAIYRDDAAFKAQWAALFVSMNTDPAADPKCVLPDGQEVFLSLEFTVKDGATAGDAVVYIDANFQRDIYNRTNPLHFIRAKDANSVVQFDTLAGFGATIDVAGATATVEIVEFAGYEITFDANGGEGGEVQTVAEGDLPVAPTVTRAGFIFLGWDPAIVAATADATYTAQWGLIGDVNFDGYVTVADAYLALRATTGEAILTNAQALVADVNRDGYVTVADALMILKFTTGEVTEFPQ